MKGEFVGSDQHAVKLYDLDAEMRALADGSTSASLLKGMPLDLLSSQAPVVKAGVARSAAVDVPGSARTSAGAPLLTLEELERSLMAPEEEEEKDGDVDDDDGTMESSSCSSGISSASKTTAVSSDGAEGWSQCSTWQACPIGHLASQRLEICTGMFAAE